MDLLKVFVIFSSLCVISLEAKSRAVAKPATQLSSSGENNKFIEDPFVFYKWPGFARAEGLYGKWPWYPAFIIDKSKEDSEEEVADDEVQNEAKDEEEDDEPEDDFDDYHPKHKYHHHHHDYRPYRKQKPVAVQSVGFGPIEGKATWYGVLRPKVRGGLSEEDVDDQEDDVGDSEEESYPELPKTNAADGPSYLESGLHYYGPWPYAYQSRYLRH